LQPDSGAEEALPCTFSDWHAEAGRKCPSKLAEAQEAQFHIENVVMAGVFISYRRNDSDVAAGGSLTI